MYVMAENIPNGLAQVILAKEGMIARGTSMCQNIFVPFVFYIPNRLQNQYPKSLEVLQSSCSSDL